MLLSETLRGEADVARSHCLGRVPEDMLQAKGIPSILYMSQRKGVAKLVRVDIRLDVPVASSTLRCIYALLYAKIELMPC